MGFRIDTHELEESAEGKTEELAKFLSSKLDAEIKVSSGEIAITFEGESLRRYLRVLVRKFLHKEGLNEDFKFISCGSGKFIVKRRKR